MKITICGSIAFIDQMANLANQLEDLGHEAKTPPLKQFGQNGEEISAQEYYRLKKEGPDKNRWLWKTHRDRIQAHFDKIEWSDAILVLNLEKNGVTHYIGPNTLIEMGLAFFLKKPIYLYNPIPQISYVEEILGLEPLVLNGDLNQINNIVRARSSVG